MQLHKFLKLNTHSTPVDFEILEETTFDKFRRKLIRYQSRDRDWIPAYLFIPLSAGPHPAVLIHHQHNGEWQLGKSEVAGIAGNLLQAFGLSLVELGNVVLAPESIFFEDRPRRPDGTSSLNHFRDAGEYPLTEKRRAVILDWFERLCADE